MSTLPPGKKEFLLEGLSIRGGISNWQLDDIGGWSMTPVHLAEFIFKRVNICSRDKVLETCGGVGADTAVLSSLGASVTTYEPDENRYKMLEHNTRVATVGICSKQLEIHNSVCNLGSSKKCSIVYLDVPWGGPEVMKSRVLEKMFLGDLELGDIPGAILKDRQRRVKMIYKLPPNYAWEILEEKAKAAGVEHGFESTVEYIVPPPHARSGKIPKVRWLVVAFRKTLKTQYTYYVNDDSNHWKINNK